MTYLPINDVQFPDKGTPFTLNYITSKGHKRTWQYSADAHRPSKAGMVAAEVIVQEPPASVRIAKEFLKETKSELYLTQVTPVMEWLQEQGLLVEKERPKQDWLETKLRKDFQLNTRQIKAVRNWFEDPAKYPKVTEVTLLNRILTVETLDYGKRIVTPSGHTLAYTAAHRIWEERNCSSRLREVRAKERSGKHLLMSRSFDLRYYGNGDISIGCQCIPYQAMADLAERENWTTQGEY